MYVIILSMKSTTYKNAISKQWWYLWGSNPCCSKKKNTANNNIKQDSHEYSQHYTQQDRSLDTRDKILLAAFNEIYKTGFQAASLSNILKDTGITKGALYHHFENKIVLGHAVVDEVIRDTIYSSWIEPLNNSDDPITVLKNTLMQTGSVMTEEDVCLGCPLNNLAQEMSPIDEGFRNRIAGIYEEWQGAIEASLDRGKSSGNVKEFIDSKEVSLMFVASLQGFIGYAKSVQKLEALMTCGKGLVDRLESLRPSK